MTALPPWAGEAAPDLPDDAGDDLAIRDQIARLRELSPDDELELGLAAAFLAHVVVQEVTIVEPEAPPATS